MSKSELLEFVETGDFDGLESRCLELLETGELHLGELAAPFEAMQAAGAGERVLPLAQMVVENADLDADPAGAIAVVQALLAAKPNDADLRKMAVGLYTRAYGQTPGFAAIMDASGLAGGRPLRSALKVLDLCLNLDKGDSLISRTDDRAAEVIEIDREHALFTLRRGGRVTTLPGPEVAREYDRVERDDFRVLRQLHPERLSQMIESDPLALVIGLIRANGDHLDQDRLKSELVPKYIESKGWTRWWNRVRKQLKHCPNVIIEGRAPVFLSYTAQGQTLEDETRARFEADADPMRWLAAMEDYLKERSQRKEQPDPELVERFLDHVVRHIKSIRSKRPGEALACALVLERLTKKGLPATEDTQTLALSMLRDAANPVRMVSGLEHDALWTRAAELLPKARPDDWGVHTGALMPLAPAGQLDRIAKGAVKAGLSETVQQHIDATLDSPIEHIELIYWLWKGPNVTGEVRLPPADSLLACILDTLSALGRSLTPPAEVMKQFRLRMRAALGLRDYARVRECLGQVDEARAITIRGQLERMEGLGDNARYKLLDILRSAHPRLWVKEIKRLEPWEDPDVIWATQEGLRKRTAERDELVNVKMPENAKKIGEAASHGDLSENSEYKFALEERDLLRARVAQINAELSLTRLLEAGDVPADHVGVGSRVTLRDVQDGSERVLVFLGPFDANVEEGIVNYKAPVGQKIMGRYIGDRVSITLDGAEHELEIIGLGNALNAAAGGCAV